LLRAEEEVLDAVLLAVVDARGPGERPRLAVDVHREPLDVDGGDLGAEVEAGAELEVPRPVERDVPLDEELVPVVEEVEVAGLDEEAGPGEVIELDAGADVEGARGGGEGAGDAAVEPAHGRL